MSDEAREFGIRDGVEHPIEDLDPREKEVRDVLNLLRDNPIVIVTAGGNAQGKSTFGVILRHHLLTLEPSDPQFPDAVFMDIGYVQATR